MKKDALRPIEAADIAGYQIPANLIYSPDGTYLAFQVKRADVRKNTYINDIYLYRSGSGEAARQITFSAGTTLVGWRNDTELILRRSVPDTGRKGSSALPETHLFLLDVTGGEARPWITLPFTLVSFDRVAEDLYAAVGKIDAADPDLYKAPAEARREKAVAIAKEKDYTVVDEIPYWSNGVGYTNGQRNALFSVSVENGAPAIRRLTPPQFQTISVCADDGDVYYCGRRIAGLDKRRDQVYVWHSATGKKETLYGRSDRGITGLFRMNGRLYVFAADYQEYGIKQTPAICLLEGGVLTSCYAPEITLHNAILSDTFGAGKDAAVAGEAGSQRYLTIATDTDQCRLLCFDERWQPEILLEHPGAVEFMAASNGKIALCCQDWNEISEIYEAEADGSGIRKVTDLNGKALEGRYIAEPQPLCYTSEGYDLKGWVLLPPGFDPKKKYPAILDIHGGPRTSYGAVFMHEMQFWAGRGFLVFFTNIFGSDSRGDAFANLSGKYGTTDYRNLMDFTDEVLAAYPCIDEKRLCVTGGSYGGFMTNWIIGHTHRFCAAASQRSISNWISMNFISDIGYYFGFDQCGAGDPFDFEPQWRSSPLRYIKGAKTPTLFIHSDEDYRCPLPEGMQIMQALRLQGVDTRLVIFHGENHELSRNGKPLHRMRRLNEIIGWFEKYAK